MVNHDGIRTKSERLEKIIETMNKLRDLKLLQSGHSAIDELKKKMTEFLDTPVSLYGSIPYEEIGRVIEYQLPILLDEQILVKMSKIYELDMGL
jgi:hypothetical protein